MKSFTSFDLKRLALIFMVIDHFAVIVLQPFLTSQTVLLYNVYVLLRIVGRLAFPLFAFMIVEGVIHTKNTMRYLSQLFSMAVLIGLAIYVLNNQGYQIAAGNIFIDLFFGGLAVTLLYQSKWSLKFLAIIPIIYIGMSQLYNFENAYAADYGLYGLVMMLGFFIARMLSRITLLKVIRSDTNRITVLNAIRPFYFSSASLFIVNILWYIMYFVSSNPALAFIGIQSYSIFAGILIVRYSGTLGSPPRWFKAFTYAFYPLHFIVLYGLYLLVVAII